MPDCAFLTERIADFEAARSTYEARTRDVDGATANHQPRPGSWSAAESLAHLTLTARGYFPRLEKSIALGRAKGRTGSAPFTRNSLLGGLLTRTLAASTPKKVKSPGVFKPKSQTLDWASVKRDFESDLDRLIELARSADGLDLDRCRLPTPILPFPRITAAEAFRIHSLHIPRHLEQARRAIDAAGSGADR